MLEQTGELPCWSLPELQYLDVSNNMLTAMPCTLAFDVDGFYYLAGASNQLTVLPRAIDTVYFYYFSNNPIVDASAIYLFPNVWEVDVYGCSITGWPLPDFNQWTQMDMFLGGKNQFVGQLRADSFADMEYLYQMDLSYNNLVTYTNR